MNPHAHIGPPSPWRGSEHLQLLGWELDDVNSLPEAAFRIREISAELRAAHTAGWYLVSTMLDGRLHARRSSRRQRARTQPDADVVRTAPNPVRVRIRIVNETASPIWPSLTVDAAIATPWLAFRDGGLQHVAGPEPDDADLRIVTEQVDSGALGSRRWAVVSARVGPGLDLVAEGSGLRAHAIVDGVVVRTQETLSLKHAADNATTLPDAAAAYSRSADTAVAMSHAGGTFSSIDDGFLVVEYSDDTR